jgi:hypothetical protein
MPRSVSSSTAAALQRCREAYLAAQAEYVRNHGGPQEASQHRSHEKGAEAFRRSFPALSNRRNVANFIACVAYGVLIDAIPGNIGPTLIYAARAVQNALPAEPKTAKNSKNTPPSPRGNQKVIRVKTASNDRKNAS